MGAPGASPLPADSPAFSFSPDSVCSGFAGGVSVKGDGSGGGAPAGASREAVSGYGSLEERLVEPYVHEAIGFFLSQWIAFERAVR